MYRYLLQYHYLEKVVPLVPDQLVSLAARSSTLAVLPGMWGLPPSGVRHQDFSGQWGNLSTLYHIDMVKHQKSGFNMI
jgi:hypothetical protein